MALTTVSLSTTFNTIAGNIVPQDVTNYLSQGIDFSGDGQAFGYLKVEFNAGLGFTTLYDNLSGIPSSADSANGVFSTQVAYPTTVDGAPLPAAYRLTYKVVADTSAGNPGNIQTTVTQSFEYEYSLGTIDICINTTVNCAASSLSSADDSVYTQLGATINSIVRAHTLYPPPASGLAIAGPLDLQEILYTPIATTTWTAELISTVTYTQDLDGLIVIFDFVGSKEFQVSCDTNLSRVLCCLTTMQSRYETLLSKNPVKAEAYGQSVVQPTLSHLVLFLAAQSAGNLQKMDEQYEALIRSSNCTGDCQDCGGTSTPAIIQSTNNSGAGNVYLLQSPNNTITIGSSVVGATTVFSIDVSQAIMNIISQLVVTTVSTNSPYLLIAPSGSNPKDYQIRWVGPTISTAEVLDQVITFTAGNTSNYMDAVVQTIEKLGNGWEATPVYKLGQSSPNVSTDTAFITITNLFSTPGSTFSVSTQTNKFNSTFVYSLYKGCECEVVFVDYVAGSVTIRLYDVATGLPILLSDLFRLSVNIALTIKTS